MFEPTRQAALARLAAVNPKAYASTRNALEGAVTYLSPYITHGFLTLTDVLKAVHCKHPLPLGHKFVFELGWRAYFQHVWAHDGERIFASLHEGPLPDDAYAQALPPDIREGRTGIAAIDMAVHTLYTRGYLHNHARMWLASYVVHVRRVHWRAGADWLYGHLLDGDLASNHLSWQWVAGTGSHKPYLFNADNVAQYAPAQWHSQGTCIDIGYDAMQAIACGGKLPRLAALGTTALGMIEPTLLHTPPVEYGFTQPAASLVAGRHVRLIHPWSLGATGTAASTIASAATMQDADSITVAMCPAELTARFAWSPARWRFVCQALAAHTPHLWFGNSSDLVRVLSEARSVQGTHNLHLPVAWQTLRLSPQPLFAQPPLRRCQSFSQYWNAVTGKLGSVEELISNVGAI